MAFPGVRATSAKPSSPSPRQGRCKDREPRYTQKQELRTPYPWRPGHLPGGKAMPQRSLGRAVKAAEGLRLQGSGIPATRKHPCQPAPGTDSSLPRTGLNHWKYQNNDEVTFPAQGAGARYSRAEKRAKMGLGVPAGGSGRQAPRAFVAFKNSLRLPGDFFFPFFPPSPLCREQGTGQHNRGFKLFIHPAEKGTNIAAHECMDLGSRNKARVKF